MTTQKHPYRRSKSRSYGNKYVIMGCVISFIIMIAVVSILFIGNGNSILTEWLGLGETSTTSTEVKPSKPNSSMLGKLPESEHRDGDSSSVSPDDTSIIPNEGKQAQGGGLMPEAERERIAKLALAKLSLEQKVGQMLYVDLASLTAKQPTLELAAELEKLAPGGVILFRSELTELEQTVRYTAMLQQLKLELPLWIGTDQEGGLVTRISYASELNGNMALAATGDTKWTTETASRTAEMLHSLGMNLNFAPVADVNVNPNNPVIGIRSFGAKPERVSDYVQAYIAGMHAKRMPAVVKHFPGHGDTATDSHVGLPILKHAREQLERVDWVPFRGAIDQGVDMIMTAHVAVPAIDDTQVNSKLDGKLSYLPSTLSQPIISGILRDQLHYDGVVITDAMNMGAVVEHFGTTDAAIRAVEAGVDMLLMPPQPAIVKQKLVEAVRAGKLSEQRINESVLRILKLKATYGLLDSNGDSTMPLTYESQLLAAKQWKQQNTDEQFAVEVAKAAVTYIGDPAKLPLMTKQMKRVVMIGNDAYALQQFKLAMDAAVSSANGLSGAATAQWEVWTQVIGTEASIQDTLSKLSQKQGEDVVLVITRDVHEQTNKRKLLQSAIDQLAKTKLPYGLIAVSSPYDVVMLKDAPFSIATYGMTAANLRAAADFLWAEQPNNAILPIE